MTQRLEFARGPSLHAVVRRRAAMSDDLLAPHASRLDRRQFLTRAGWTGLGAGALVAGAGRRRALAQARPSYPDWIAASPKPPKRGGRAHPRLVVGPAGARPAADAVGRALPVRGPRRQPPRPLRRSPTRRAAPPTSRLKGDLAESWQASPDHRVWTFKLRQGVKWHNVPPLNGRELVAADVKYCFEAYAKEGVQSFTFQEIEGDRDARTSTRCASISRRPTCSSRRTWPSRHGDLLRARSWRRTAISRSA